MDENGVEALIRFWKGYLRFVGRGCARFLPAKTAAEILTRAMTEAVTEGELSNEAKGLLLRESERQYRRERDRDEAEDDLTVLYAVFSILYPVRPRPMPIHEILGQIAKLRPFRNMSYARLEEILVHFASRGYLVQEGERFFCRGDGAIDLSLGHETRTNL
jgi:hypothetical protein